MYFQVTLDSHCPSVSKTTQPYVEAYLHRAGALYPVAFLRRNVTYFMLHPPPHIPTYSLYHTSLCEIFVLQSSPTSSPCLHHSFPAPRSCLPITVPTNSLVCPSPARRTALIADRSLQPLLCLLQSGKSSQAQLNTSDLL